MEKRICVRVILVVIQRVDIKIEYEVNKIREVEKNLDLFMMGLFYFFFRDLMLF